MKISKKNDVNILRLRDTNQKRWKLDGIPFFFWNLEEGKTGGRGEGKKGQANLELHPRLLIWDRNFEQSYSMDQETFTGNSSNNQRESPKISPKYGEHVEKKSLQVWDSAHGGMLTS